MKIFLLVACLTASTMGDNIKIIYQSYDWEYGFIVPRKNVKTESWNKHRSVGQKNTIKFRPEKVLSYHNTVIIITDTTKQGSEILLNVRPHVLPRLLDILNRDIGKRVYLSIKEGE